jgi:glycosyltransferase involved in cell wall biosynthesis
MNVFTDFHHASLLQSFIFLFEKRLGGQVYRPIGKEWFDEGFWKVYDHPATVEQFLGIGGNTPDGTEPLNDVLNTLGPYVYSCHDIDSGLANKAITYEGFMQTKFDIVIASLPYHIEPFKKLCDIHPNKPKLIYQIGNAWTVEAGLAKNVMASAIIHDVPSDIHFISYHQEFDTEIFKPSPEAPSPWITSFVNVFNGESHFAADWQLFLEVEKYMDDFTFKSHGGQCRDGAIGPAFRLAKEMQQSRFVWHTKAGGDGYGHIIYNVAACGRPMIVKKGYYNGKMGDELFIDGETCIVIDNLSVPEIAEKIRHYEQPDLYRDMCKNVYENFKKCVDFDKEAIQLQKFFSELL